MKKLVALLMVVMLFCTSFVGCKNDATSNADGERIKITVGYPNADESWKNDEYFKYITDKLNIDIEFMALSPDSAAEKARIWISSGDMPDVVYSDFMLDEYNMYGKQGIVKQLPEDWETKYPNLGFSMAMTGALQMLKEQNDGAIYGLLRPMDHYSQYLAEFRQAYKEGKDLKQLMSEEPMYRYIDKQGFAYRKDWAEQLGIETDTIMKYDDFISMVKKFKEADLGGVGANNTVGIAVDYTEAPNIFISAYNGNYKYFHKDEDGKYVCGLLEDSTANGIAEYQRAYKEGILSPSFYTLKSQDLNSLFCSERSGVIFPRAVQSQMTTLNSDFEKANPGKKATDCIDVCWLVGPSGKVPGIESGNYYGAYYFNPDMDDKKMDAILRLADYVSSPDGGPQVRLGVPGVDYEEKDGEYVVIREKNESGSYDSLDKKYPSYEFFRNFLNPQFNLEATPVDPYAKECMDKLTAAKLESDLDLVEWDLARDSYVTDEYVKFNAAYEVNAMFADIIVTDGDAKENWLKKRKEIEKDALKIEEHMNRTLIK